MAWSVGRNAVLGVLQNESLRVDGVVHDNRPRATILKSALYGWFE